MDISGLFEVTLVAVISFGFGEGGPISQKTCELLLDFWISLAFPSVGEHRFEFTVLGNVLH